MDIAGLCAATRDVRLMHFRVGESQTVEDVGETKDKAPDEISVFLTKLFDFCIYLFSLKIISCRDESI